MKYYLIVILASHILLSCVHEPITVIADNYQPNDSIPIGTPHSCEEDSIYFNEQVLPIFINSCAVSGCHDQETHEEDLILDSYSNIIASGEIEPYNLNEGDIYEAITENQSDDDFMPPSDSEIDPLTEEQIAAIALWINQGLPDNSCPDLVCDTLEVTFSGDIAPMIDTYCIGCHNGGSNGDPDVVLDGYNAIKFYASTGALVGTISNTEGYAVMPSNTSGLSDCQVRMVEMWIEDGMPEN